MKNIFLIIAVIAIGVLLFGWNRFFGSEPEPDAFAYWQDTQIRCIPGHQNLEFHFHPLLAITVDGAAEPVPAEIGISPNCMAEVHTHDESGTLHIEGLETRDFYLKDFLAVWGRAIERDGYTLTVLSNGNPVEDYANLELGDAQQVLIQYETPK